MKTLQVLLLASLIATLSSCGSTERSKARAETELTKETTKTMQEYKACRKKAGEDQQKLDACERIIKAIQTQ